MKTDFNSNRILGTGRLSRLVTRAALLWAVAVAATFGAQTATVPAPTSYQVVRRDANSDILQQTVSVTSPSGKTTSHVRSVTRIATGLNYWDGLEFSPSDPTFQISPDGQYVFANKVQTQVRLSANLASSNSVVITTPDGIVLNTTPVAIGLYDEVSGNSTIIAAITNCSGTLISSNQVLYENAFEGDGISGDILYTLERGSFSQDVIWRQNINPADYNFPTNSTQLQIFSAFNSPAPQEIARPLYVETNQAIRAQMASPDFIDHTLKFGQLKFGPGRTFSTTATNTLTGAPIAKDFETINGQSYLIESVEYSEIQSQLQSLTNAPVSRTSKLKHQSRAREQAVKLSLRPRAKGLRFLAIPVPRSATKATFAINHRENRLADAMKPKGVISDFIALPATEPNPMVFQSDQTFFVDGPAVFEDVVLEGACVIKYPNDTNAYIEVDGNLICETQPYLPAIFTAADDDSVGQSMSGIWTNYTGTIQPGGYAEAALYLTTNSAALNNLRILDAVTGIYGYGDLTATNLQILNCGYAFYIGNQYNSLFENVLIANVNYAFGGTYTMQATAENTTVANCNLLLGDNSGISFYFYNSILANVTNLVSAGSIDLVTGNNNGFDYCNNAGPGATNLDGVTTNAWPFQTVGAGSYYLATNCVFHAAGTTNIDRTLLADLTQRTTWPPNVYDEVNISSNLTLGPSVPRDTNSSPDLGYHYDTLDDVFAACQVSTNLTFTNGVDIGFFGDSGPFYFPYSISLNDGASMSFNGNATQPCRFSLYSLVQEGENGNWTAGENGGFEGGIVFNGSSTIPQLSANFTKWGTLPERQLFNDDSASGGAEFRNCELYNCSLSTYGTKYVDFTNCLIFRPYITFWDNNYPISYSFENCTFYNGGFYSYRQGSDSSSFWLIENCSFDGTAFDWTDDLNGNPTNTLFNFNSYNTNNLSWTNYQGGFSSNYGTNEVVGPKDLMTTNYNWETSWFGNFYLPTNSALLQKGSTNANFLGLYEFTTQTNQTPETNAEVDIGYHYVATDTNGNPLDTYVAGTPNYIVDSRGNGIDTSGLPYWWETLYFGTLSVDPNGDASNDGLNNLEKYQLGLNPLVPYPAIPASFSIQTCPQ